MSPLPPFPLGEVVEWEGGEKERKRERERERERERVRLRIDTATRAFDNNTAKFNAYK